MARPRIDLDGVTLSDPDREHSAPLVIFRRRTTAGLVLLMPESADFTVAWEHVVDASLDLKTGAVRLAFEPAWAAEQRWLRGATTVTGIWSDRYISPG